MFQGYLTPIRGIYKLNICVRKNEVRMLGIIENTPPETNKLPVFQVFHVFHKKSQEVKDKDIEVALSRSKIYQNYKDKK